MEWIETTGRTIDEAKEAALAGLGVDEADAEFEIVAQPQTGLFGRIRGEARVRARVRPTAPRAKEDRRDRRRRSPASGSRRDEGNGNGGTSGSERSAGSRARGADEVVSSADSTESGAGGAVATAGSARSGGSGRSSGDGRSGGDGGKPGGAQNRRRRRRRGRSGGSPRNDVVGRDEADTDEESYDEADEIGLPTVKGTEVEVPLDQQAEVAVDFLTKLTAEFGLDARVSVTHPDEDTVELQLYGSDLGILIGPKGATLIALQNLTRTVVFNETGANNGHINVDVGGYRQKRTEALVRFATQVAEKVKESGNRTALEPMSAVDRKVVHDTVSGIDGVSTTSEGEEPRRRVVVFPG